MSKYRALALFCLLGGLLIFSGISCDGGIGQAVTPFQTVTSFKYFNRADFGEDSATITNKFLPYTVGTTFTLRKQTDEGLEEITITVTRDTRTVFGVNCRDVRDTVRLDGELVEDTIDFFAQDLFGNVWYFGEDSKDFEDGEVVSTAGSWVAGENDALPGVLMPAEPRVGDILQLELAPGVALDRAEVESLSETVDVPFGTFRDCLESRESTPLEPDVEERKFYAPNVGLVLETDEEGVRTELIDKTPR